MQPNLNVSRETSDKLTDYISLLKLWNRSINLVCERDLNFLQEKHINDCIHLQNIIQKEGIINIADIGSGNGLPGIIVAIYLPDKHVTLIDVDQRKSAFLREVIAKLQLNASVVNKDVRKIEINAPSIITAKAFKPVSNMLSMLEKTLANNIIYMMKGVKMDDEIEKARENWRFDAKVHTLSDKSYILRLENIERKNG